MTTLAINLFVYTDDPSFPSLLYTNWGQSLLLLLWNVRFHFPLRYLGSEELWGDDYLMEEFLAAKGRLLQAGWV